MLSSWLSGLLLICTFAWSFGQSKTAAAEYATLDISFDTGIPAQSSHSNLIVTNQGISNFRKNEDGILISPSHFFRLGNPVHLMSLVPVLHGSNLLANGIQLEVRFSDDQVTWTPWREIRPSWSHAEGDSTWIGEPTVVEINVAYFQYRLIIFPNNPAVPLFVKSLKWDQFTPGNVSPVNPEFLQPISYPRTDPNCPCPLPVFATRQQWGNPNGNGFTCSPLPLTSVSHILVYQSGIPGDSATTNWAAQALALEHYHTQSLGMCDIGFNWMIDPAGIIYEGRGGGDDVRGEHFCGQDAGTMSICMLGDFSQNPPTLAAFTSLANLIAWKACDSDIVPTNTLFHLGSLQTLPVVSAFDGSCNHSTMPGTALSNLIPAIKQRATTQLNACQATSLLAEMNEGIEVFPNPADQEISISIPESMGTHWTYQLLNMTGQLVDTQPSDGSGDVIRLDVSTLPAGIYLLRLTHGDWNTVRKISIR
ncbi:T9SS type A sorting domain-containing protein [Pontibacter sp. G13]|uniref:T9SS type A sorting domain-containing protein n=1 Tax=Pontibacter sp. G13 TaxID=3074898 RepID=UPI00288C3721|nr:T9SS type A sorting domain-containing protein [Pontibacter sp. G13]WNJ17985.1 T9SS type A sorting domain-containing protein [Pontibacter sp. G13]